MFRIITPKYLDNVLNIKLVHLSLTKKASNHSWSRSNQSLNLMDFPWKLYFLVFSFSFLFSDSLRWIISACAYNPCYIAIISKLLWLQTVGTEVQLIFLHWSTTYGQKSFVAAKNGVSITSYIGLQFLKYFQPLLSLYLDIPKSSAPLPLK